MKFLLPISLATSAFAIVGVAASAASPGGTQEAMDHGVEGTIPSANALPVPQSVPDDPTKPVKLQARLDGNAETGTGDKNALGVFAGRLNRAEGQLCYSMKVTNLKTPTAAKIHAGPAGAPGNVALTLEPPSNGESTGCVDVTSEVADAMVTKPENFYVNVQNAEFRNGAIRGQLSGG